MGRITLAVQQQKQGSKDALAHTFFSWKPRFSTLSRHKCYLQRKSVDLSGLNGVTFCFTKHNSNSNKTVWNNYRISLRVQQKFLVCIASLWYLTHCPLYITWIKQKYLLAMKKLWVISGKISYQHNLLKSCHQTDARHADKDLKWRSSSVNVCLYAMKLFSFIQAFLLQNSKTLLTWSQTIKQLFCWKCDITPNIYYSYL